MPATFNGSGNAGRSGRTRLILFGILLGAGALAGIGVLIHSALETAEYEEARRVREQLLSDAVKAAMAQPVESGKPWSCTTRPELYRVAFAIRGPAGVDLPGLLDPRDPFELSATGSASVPHSSRYLLFVEVRSEKIEFVDVVR